MQSCTMDRFKVIVPQQNYTGFFPCSLITNLQFHLLPVASNFFCLSEGFRTFNHCIYSLIMEQVRPYKLLTFTSLSKGRRDFYAVPLEAAHLLS